MVVGQSVEDSDAEAQLDSEFFRQGSFGIASGHAPALNLDKAG